MLLLNILEISYTMIFMEEKKKKPNPRTTTLKSTNKKLLYKEFLFLCRKQNYPSEKAMLSLVLHLKPMEGDRQNLLILMKDKKVTGSRHCGFSKGNQVWATWQPSTLKRLAWRERGEPCMCVPSTSWHCLPLHPHKEPVKVQIIYMTSKKTVWTARRRGLWSVAQSPAEGMSPVEYSRGQYWGKHCSTSSLMT